MTVTGLAYAAMIDDWRAQAEANLRADDGWLTLAGLFWLEEGANRFGSDGANEIVLPARSAPGVVGSFYYHDGRVTLEAVPGLGVTVNGEPAGTQMLRSAAEGGPDVVEIGDLRLLVHRSGLRSAIRLRDRNHPARQDFGGRRWFPAQAQYRVTARFVPYDQPRQLANTNIVGDRSDIASPGYLLFSIGEQQCRLDASSWHDGGLSLHFHDLTSGHETYPGGRFLTTPPPAQGQVALDFNQAVNPPCAFTAFATCPMILPQNKLAVRIAAGELRPDLAHEL